VTHPSITRSRNIYPTPPLQLPAPLGRDVLCQNFPLKWNSWDGPVTWSPRSPELIPFHFAFWSPHRVLLTFHHCPRLCRNFVWIRPTAATFTQVMFT